MAIMSNSHINSIERLKKYQTYEYSIDTYRHFELILLNFVIEKARFNVYFFD